jgi:hypothetical protein
VWQNLFRCIMVMEILFLSLREFGCMMPERGFLRSTSATMVSGAAPVGRRRAAAAVASTI